MSTATERLTEWLSRCRTEEIDNALDSLDGAVEELTELARKKPGTLEVEVEREYERAQSALESLAKALRELETEQAS